MQQNQRCLHLRMIFSSMTKVGAYINHNATQLEVWSVSWEGHGYCLFITAHPMRFHLFQTSAKINADTVLKQFVRSRATKEY